jgi:hypothetical protein
MEEVTVRPCHEHRVEVDDNNALTVGDPGGILGELIRPHLMHLLDTNIIA